MTEQGAAVAGVTGDPRVDAVLARLDVVEQLDLPAQVTAFTEVQAGLAVILDEPAAADGSPTASASAPSD